VPRASGRELTVEPYFRYLTKKYQPLYGLPDEVVTAEAV
jgi:hypothetical protein